MSQASLGVCVERYGVITVGFDMYVFFVLRSTASGEVISPAAGNMSMYLEGFLTVHG